MFRLLLPLSYAFSIWMCVDAYKRGMQGWWFIIILVPFGEWVYFFAVKMEDMSYSRGSGSGFVSFGNKLKCRSCDHCVAIYQDGVRCQIGDHQPIFKDMSHISFCSMHSHQQA